ncbi:leishmanolysin peptidase (macronuclear) [Tetrahymena thermophila SB210]|uniref:Leishmanolysin peptidase n=1 Tax=Tetrahymena thermophila (strain SB210) TaxID=312017 RepID=I7MKV0_TETTS|nr:leishmanolysin peptidase [Tetrahymena thermophila SB210]EAS00360.3 leishmanolysin peptidase [Tetrahymena thermophila SB210]|eukprot:XP_001020605.3 leishmanolysin peptidase [Tetrahymena thermophila SB210]
MSETQSMKLPQIHQKNQTISFQVQIVNDSNDNSVNQNQKQLNMSKSLTSPFKIPTDEEIFQFYEIEKQKKNESRNQIINSKIWEKKTFSQKRSLKHFKDIQPETLDNYRGKNCFKDNQKKLIQEALNVAKERQNQDKGNFKNESLNEILNQRKEMFLVTMSHDIIANEINRIKKLSEDREQALISSEKMLKQDYENFQKYLDQNKQQRIDAEQRAEALNKQRRQKEVMIKEINLKLTTIRAEKSRNEEILAGYKEHKEFLDKLAPKDWEEEKQRKKIQLVDKLKLEFIEKQQDSLNERNNKGSKQKKDSGFSQTNTLEKKQLQIQKIENQFYSLVEKDELSDLEDFEDNYPMYFQNPQQLQDVFNSLEEKNLFLIQMKQEDEQNLEELKHKFKQEKQLLNAKARNLQIQKDLLKKQVEEISTGMKSIKQKTEDLQNKSEDKYEKLFRALIVDLYNTFKEEINLHDPESQSTLFLLSQIEILFEKQFKEIKLCPIKLVEEKRKKAEKDRKQSQRDAQNKKKEDEVLRRNEKNRIKMEQPSKKKIGRIDMIRSAPFIKIVNKEQTTQDNQEDEDMKYFREDYRLF